MSFSNVTQPWIENELQGGSSCSSQAGLPEGQPDFSSIPTNGAMVFGGYQKPEFSRDYDSSKVGDPKRLPRGKMKLKNTPPTEFYKSIHLGGVEAISQQREAAAKEKVTRKPWRLALLFALAACSRLSSKYSVISTQADWLAKVKVDTLDFKMVRLLSKDRPYQLDRATDILALPANKKIFKKVRKVSWTGAVVWVCLSNLTKRTHTYIYTGSQVIPSTN